MLDALRVRAYGFPTDPADLSGSKTLLMSRAGSNKLALATGAAHEVERDLRTIRAAGSAAGPLVRDRLWYAVGADVTGAAGRTVDFKTRQLEGAARLTWQVNSRNKLGLLTIANADRSDRDDRRRGRRGFVGLTFESLLRDDLFLRIQAAAAETHDALDASAFHDLGRTRALELRALLQGWWTLWRLEHDTTLAMRLLRADHAEAARSDRLALDLSDRLSLGRHVTVHAGLGWLGDPGGAASADSGLTPHLGLAWDATRDGRTVVRASLERFRKGAALAATPADGLELGFGAEREIVRETALSLDLVYRRPSRSSPTDRQLGITAAVLRHEGPLRLFGGYALQRDAANLHTIKLHAVAKVVASLSLGGLYHLSAGGARGASHEGGVRAQGTLRIAGDGRLTLFADGVASRNSPAGAYRAALGLEAAY
jgi:hypothetical protein